MAGAGAPQGLELRHLRYFVALADAGNFTRVEPEVWIPSSHPAARRGAISVDELAGLQVIHGPRRLEPGTYDAWTTAVQTVNPRFEFTDPPFRCSLPVTLAFAATGNRPVAVLTGPATATGSWAGPAPAIRPRLMPAAWSGSASSNTPYRLGGPGLERRPAPPAAAAAVRHRRQPDGASPAAARRTGLLTTVWPSFAPLHEACR